MEQASTGNAKLLASSPPERTLKKLRTSCAELVPNLQQRMSWNAHGVRVINTGNVQRSVLMCVMLYSVLLTILYSFVLPVFNYSLLHWNIVTLSHVLTPCIAHIESSLSEIQKSYWKETVWPSQQIWDPASWSPQIHGKYAYWSCLGCRC